MIATSTELFIMVRRCLLTFKPFRIFVVGIGFFSLCFLMTSLGGQFSAKRPGDSPFTVRAEVLGGQESRGVLRKISDMLEVIMKRMDALSKLGNTTDTHRLDELSSALDRIQPVGLVERIQAIAQNMSDMAVRVEQILQRSMASSRVRDGALGQCETPKDPRYPDCPSKMDWMRARWTSDPCYAFYGVDGSDCSFLVYLSEVEWFCPPLAWRNQTATPTLKPPPKRQAVFQSDIGTLLEQVGTGKESLSFMKRRIRRLAAQWASAARRLDDKLRNHWREQKRILVHVGFLTEESGDVFSPKVLKGGPLGEMVQWADILTALYVLGHNLKISVSLKELHGVSFQPEGLTASLQLVLLLPAAAHSRVITGLLLVITSISAQWTRTRAHTHTHTKNIRLLIVTLAWSESRRVHSCLGNFLCAAIFQSCSGFTLAGQENDRVQDEICCQFFSAGGWCEAGADWLTIMCACY